MEQSKSNFVYKLLYFRYNITPLNQQNNKKMHHNEGKNEPTTKRQH